MPDTLNFTTCIHCMTFNHANYIEATMDGFVKQQTTFPFVSLIIDDASNDGESVIILKYIQHNLKIVEENSLLSINGFDAHYLLAINNSNPNCYFAVYLLKQNLYGSPVKANLVRKWDNQSKYIALCEGDDYWTDPNKLQKQVDYLEAHPECSLCFTNAIVHWYNGEQEDRIFASFEERDYSGVELCEKWISPTASFLFRTPIFKDYEQIRKDYPQIIIGDSPLLLTCAKKGKIHGIPEITCVYGKHANGWTQYTDASRTYLSARSWEAQLKAFGKDYKTVMSNTFIGQYLLAIHRSIKDRNWTVFVKSVFRGIVAHPFLSLRSLYILWKERRQIPQKSIVNA